MNFKKRADGMLPGHGVLRPWGVLLHTTGNGIPEHARLHGSGPLEAAVHIYATMREGPHLILAPSGDVLQVRELDQVAWHAGVSEAQRLKFLHETWEKDVPVAVSNWWHDRWPSVRSPQHLYPTVSPNLAYVGVEMVPCGVMEGGAFKPLWGRPAHPGARFTLAQYVSAANLTIELSKRAGWYGSIATPGARVCGHEDVNPVTRPGWDPGSYTGAWSWDTFNEILTTLVRNE